MQHPNPDTAAGRAEIAGQKCTLCRAEIPGDPAQCYAICMQRIEDQGTYLKALGGNYTVHYCARQITAAATARLRVIRSR